MSSKSNKDAKLKSERLKLSGTSNSPEGTENLFNEIQEKTGAQIQWETGKFSNTFKRDPVIRLCGHPDAVKAAREMVLQKLEMQSNKVVLKMDITHEEHPSLIGRKGCLIKKVMEATNTHIHFPDKNIISVKEKSNQVSITGEPANVEKARIMLRALLPFQVIFEVDPSAYHLVNTTSTFWRELNQKLGLAIHFIHIRDFKSCVIRCSQGHFQMLRQQMLTLIEILSAKKGSDLPPVKVVLDIMPQHVNFMKGPKGSNIQAISKRTGAKIDLPSVNFDNLKMRSVDISGNLDCVYMAWQEIMSSLPVSIVFDVNETRDTKNDCASFLTDYQISIFSRPKSNNLIKGVTVKGPEKFSKQILQYRQRVLDVPCIKFPPDYHDVNKAFSFQSNISETQQLPKLDNIALFSSISLTNIQLESLTKVLNSNSGFVDSPPVSSSYNSRICPSIAPLGERTYGDLKPVLSDLHMYYTSLTPGNSYASHTQLACNKREQNVFNNNNEGNLRESHDLESASSAKSSISSEEKISLPDSPVFKEKETNHYEIFEKKLGAYQAIHRNIVSTQVPTSLWAGYGFSQSMPAQSVASDIASKYTLESNSSCSSDEMWDKIVLADYIDEKIWCSRDGNIFSQSNVFDFKRHSSVPVNFRSEDQLPRILYEEGLYSCLDTFLKQEIDYAAFLLLNDEDLIKLGFSYSARMKIICLIRELQDAEMKTKTFDAAPGAGRKLVEV